MREAGDHNHIKQEDRTMAGENETKKDFKADIEHAGQLVLNVALPLSGTREKLEAMGRYDFIQ